ncbi:MAG TPA: hypothetical protein VHE12_06945 [bacterium]|nr:hypothetical protein [bacterium]
MSLRSLRSTSFLLFSWVLFFSFFLQTPVLAKKPNDAKVLSDINRSCREIDAQVKGGGLTVTYWAEVEEEGGEAHWVTFGSRETGEKTHPRGFWREAWTYGDGKRIRSVEMEIKTPTKEWVQRVTYYFREDGTLEKAHSDFRTFGAYERKKGPTHQFLAKILRDRFYDPKGHCIQKNGPRISNATNHRETHDVVFKDGAWPFYPKVTDLPFPVPMAEPGATRTP